MYSINQVNVNNMGDLLGSPHDYLNEIEKAPR